MTASSDNTSSASPSNRRKAASARHSYYMIAPAGPGETTQTLIDRLKRVADVEILQTYAERGTISPPVAVVRMSDENAAALRRSAGGALVIEPDRYLRAASFMGSSYVGASPPSQIIAAMNALGPGFAVTIRALSERDKPVEHVEVQLVGERGVVAQGLTDKDGKAELTLFGELPGTVTELFVKPRSGYWSLWRHRPNLQADAVNTRMSWGRNQDRSHRQRHRHQPQAIGKDRSRHRYQGRRCRTILVAGCAGPRYVVRRHHQRHSGCGPRHMRLRTGKRTARLQASSRSALQRSGGGARLLPADRYRPCVPGVRLRAGFGHRRAAYRRGKTARRRHCRCGR